MVSRLIFLALLLWLLQRGGGQSVVEKMPPILVDAVPFQVTFKCAITYPNTNTYKTFQVSYYQTDPRGQQSREVNVPCQASPGPENQTHTTDCSFPVGPFHNASATGTYYCQVKWPGTKKKGKGVFILVRDSGYKEPPASARKFLLITSTSLLAILSIVGTALLLWKTQVVPLRKLFARKGPVEETGVREPACSGPVYTSLEHIQPEVYSIIEQDPSSPLPECGKLPQEQQLKVEADVEFNSLYENF
ncbi:NFAT activation molecule 1 [Ornithorhynchus anatinus]|uniref:NFAT activation molecule 1 n=1 Tax=Ornithorhynchus anatinus TaxID=9258 RepID=UPI0010A77732|nr:NFAT activation molecule 1 [Ornithorhynchus anatinus]